MRTIAKLLSIICTIALCVSIFIVPASAAVNNASLAKTIETGIKSRTTKIDVRSQNLTTSDSAAIVKIISSVSNIGSYNWACPLSSNASFTTNGTKIEYINLTYSNTASDYSNKVKTFEAKLKSITSSTITSGMTDFQKVKALHDYIMTNTTYETGINNHTAYNCLINKKAVCQGYTTAFYELCKYNNIQCVIVVSESMNHAWNKVQISGSWYNVDCTWDSSRYHSGTTTSPYFLKSDGAFSDHTNYRGALYDSVPAASNTKYNSYKWGKLGDINFDGKVDASDVSLLRQYVVDRNTPVSKSYVADTNQDGKISIADVSTLMKLISK